MKHVKKPNVSVQSVELRLTTVQPENNVKYITK